MKIKLRSKKIQPHNLSSTSKDATLLASVEIENFEQVENDDSSVNETEDGAKQDTITKKYRLSLRKSIDKAVEAISGHFKEFAELQEDYPFAFSSFAAAPVWLPSNCIRIHSMNYQA